MKNFLDEDFLLSNPSAQRLYDEYAKNERIYDYHCHLSARDIWENRPFADLTELWLKGDHYKWRAMRALSVRESSITGTDSNWDKFLAWASAVPQCIGNPLYHWTHLELRRAFGITDLLNSDTAADIWERANRLLQQPDFSPRGFLKKFNVALVGTTDDPADSLDYHALLQSDSSMVGCAVRPNWRTDNITKMEVDGFAPYMERLSAAAGITIKDYTSLLGALGARLLHFNRHGCIAADHGLPILRYADVPSEQTLNDIVQRRLAGQSVSDHEMAQYATAVQVWMAVQYREYGWVMQLHIGAQLSNNTVMLERVGANTGFDAIRDMPISEALGKLLDAINSTHGGMPRTIVYTINPSQNEVIANLVACFQGWDLDHKTGRIQFGAAWWFNDQLDGMRRQLTQLSQMGVLSTFVGMTTDSRSFVSYPRHEYFRRLLCDMIGTWMENGEIPADFTSVGAIVKKVCFANARDFFRELPGD